tara:strand:- start:935 stop:1144 length:210 start_codon:yes stop_codon:yes gene_type:complete
MSKLMEYYKDILEEVSDVLEGGDVALDFEDAPAAATTIRIIQDIVSNALDGIDTHEKLKEMLRGLNLDL